MYTDRKVLHDGVLLISPGILKGIAKIATRLIFVYS